MFTNSYVVQQIARQRLAEAMHQAARASSSAIWTPEDEAPTTSTPPGASASGLR